MVDEGIYSGWVLLCTTTTVEPGEEVSTGCVSVMRARRIRQTSGKKTYFDALRVASGQHWISRRKKHLERTFVSGRRPCVR